MHEICLGHCEYLGLTSKKMKKMKSWDFTNDLGPVLSREDEFILDWMDCE